MENTNKRSPSDEEELFQKFKKSLGPSAEGKSEVELRRLAALADKLAGVLFDGWVKQRNTKCLDHSADNPSRPEDDQ